MGAGDIRFTFTGDSSQLKAEADKAKAALDTTGKAAAAAGKQIEGAGASTATASKNMGTLSNTVGKTAQVTGALGGVVGKLNPQLGTLVTGIGSVAGAFQAASAAALASNPVLITIAVAVAATAAAYAYLSRELEHAEEKQEKMTLASEAAQVAYLSLDAVITDAADHYRVASGEITAAGLATEKQIAKVREAFRGEEKAIDSLGLSYDDVVKRKTARWAREDLAIKQLKTEPAAHKAVKAAVDGTAEAAKAAAESDARYAADEHARLIAERDARWATAHEAVAAIQERNDAEKAARDDSLVWIEETRAAASAAEEAKRTAFRATSQATLSSSADLFGALGDLYTQDAEHKSKESKKAARESFRVAKGFAATQALINGALAITNALATLPYPAAPIAAAAAGITAGVQFAAIMGQEPQFHGGGTFEAAPSLAPDEGRAVLRDGEGVMTPETTRRMGGKAGLAALERGAGMGGTTLRIGRREVREMMRMDVLTGGLMTTTARRGALVAGRSGLAPLA